MGTACARCSKDNTSGHVDGNAKCRVRENVGGKKESVRCDNSLFVGGGTSDGDIAQYYPVRGGAASPKAEDDGGSRKFEADKRNSALSKAFKITGCMFLVCNHGINRGAMTMSGGGEKYGYVSHLLSKLPFITNFFFYDVACNWLRWARKSPRPDLSEFSDNQVTREEVFKAATGAEAKAKAAAALLHRGGVQTNADLPSFEDGANSLRGLQRPCPEVAHPHTVCLLSLFHGLAHNVSCRLKRSVRLMQGVGNCDGEYAERNFAILGRLRNSVKYSSAANMKLMLTSLAFHSNVNLQEQAPLTSITSFNRLTGELCVTWANFQKACAAAEAGCGLGFSFIRWYCELVSVADNKVKGLPQAQDLLKEYFSLKQDYQGSVGRWFHHPCSCYLHPSRCACLHLPRFSNNKGKEYAPGEDVKCETKTGS